VIEIQRQAAHAVLEVLHGHSLSRVLPALWKRSPSLTSSDRAAIQDLSFGTCRWLGTLRAVLGMLLNKHPADREVETLLLVAIYQLEWTRAAHHAVVDFAVRTCTALGKTSAKGLVNAVLRNFLRNREALLARARATEAGRYSYPQWWVDELARAWPAVYATVLEMGNAHPPMTLRVNHRLTSTEQYLATLKDAGLPAQQIGPWALRLDRPIGVESLPGFAQGLVSVQDLAAQYAAPLLDLRDGMRVLDACAAPGGKTAHLLELADIRLTALDRDAQRLKRVRENIARLRLSAATLIDTDAGDLSAWWDAQAFDRILLDAPCSASGVVRRHPDIKWLRRDDDLPRLACEQTRLLDTLWHTLAAGGKLLYVTCSVFPTENQAQIAAFLGTHRDADVVPLTPFPHTMGQLLPDPLHDGFFYALLHKLPAAD
jgi:16S rRNA (cytosine967-C5)-methyltransferase